MTNKASLSLNLQKPSKKLNREEHAVPKTEKKYMGDDEFAQLEEAFAQALQHACGERKDLRTTVLPRPPAAMKQQDIIRLR